jgi:hypothetical protein
MLSWICPDCGCDCAPTDQECPDCSDLVQAGMVALARTVQEQRDSFPPPPEIPLQDLVPGPRHSIEARPPVPAAPRYVEPQPEPISPSRPVLPPASRGPEENAPPVAPLPAPMPVTVTTKTPHRAILPGWLISVMVATILSLGGAAVIRNMETEHKAEAASAGGRLGGAVSQEASGRPVEVTALRVLGGPRFGWQLQYIVVNHSAADLGNLTLRIAVRSTDSRASAPLFTISAAVTGLAAYSSREMTTEIQDVSAMDVPQWDRLKTEVQVAKQ